MKQDPRALVVELCRHFYTLGWVSGTGGGISLRDGDRIYMAPSGTQKERLHPRDLYVLDLGGRVLEAPAHATRLSACAPLFMHAFTKRGAGAVLHSHSVNALLATLTPDAEFRTTHLEMQKGIRGTAYHDELVVPIIDNTAEEHELADDLGAAMDAYPASDAVLVRRHGVYVWGATWEQAKTQAECYDYLFEAAVKMRQLGVDPSKRPLARAAE
ncbi:MAG: methylthioribulose 1-phosphate dehydratase [Myxococcota bacterium]